MLISIIIILFCFIGVIILILTEKLNRAFAALAGAVITYFVLIYLEGLDFSIIVELLFGNKEEGYINLHSLILIMAMMIIVQISTEAGLFQAIAVQLIKMTRGEPIKLMIVICSVTIFISAILNNILTVIILIPLLVTISRILNIDPSPYILTQAVLVNIGGTLFSISSIPNILITTSTGILFSEFFLNVGIIALITFSLTVPFFIFLYKKELAPPENSSVLEEFDVWNLIQNKRLLFECWIALILLIIMFMIIPASVLSPDIIALSIAIILTVLSKLDPKTLITKIDLELILYLLGIFVIAGAFEIVGITDFLGMFILNVAGENLFSQILILLWASAFLSSSIDNIPITKVLIPVARSMTTHNIFGNDLDLYYSLAIGANWGDNLTPLGDNILVINLAEQNKRPISFRQFFKLGFCTTIFQLSIVSLIFILRFYLILGIMIIIIVIVSLLLLYLLSTYGSDKIKKSLSKYINSIRNKIIK